MLNGVNEGWLTLSRLVEIASRNPAILFGLYPKKGTIQVGSDADLVVVDLTKEITIKNEDQVTKCEWTPYDGYHVKGVPVMSLVRGQVVMENGEVVGRKRYGEYIRRQRT